MNRSTAILAIAAIAISTACASSSTNGTPTQTQTKTQAQKPVSSDPLYSLTLMRQGSVLLQQRRYQGALESFQQADRTAPGNATNKNMIGICFLRLGQYDQALLAFDQALQLVPGFTDARNNRGTTYLAMKQYRLAEVDFVAVLGDSTYSHRRQVYFNLGITYLQSSQTGAAEENFRRSIVQPSPVFGGYIQLAKIAEQHGELETARGFLEEAKLYFPEELEVPLELGKLLYLMGREDEARPYLEQVITDDPNSGFAATARTILGQS
jgi:tetratricopeptide (TPR) repeat protein